MLFAASFAAFNCAKATSCRAFAAAAVCSARLCSCRRSSSFLRSASSSSFVVSPAHGTASTGWCTAPQTGQGVPSVSPVASAAALFWFHLASAAESSLSCPTTVRRAVRAASSAAPHNFLHCASTLAASLRVFSAASCSLKMVCVCKSDASRSFAASAFSVNASPTAMRRSTSGSFWRSSSACFCTARSRSSSVRSSFKSCSFCRLRSCSARSCSLRFKSVSFSAVSFASPARFCSARVYCALAEAARAPAVFSCASASVSAFWHCSNCSARVYCFCARVSASFAAASAFSVRAHSDRSASVCTASASAVSAPCFSSSDFSFVSHVSRFAYSFFCRSVNFIAMRSHSSQEKSVFKMAAFSVEFARRSCMNLPCGSTMTCENCSAVRESRFSA